jgi:hypothetical protein
VILGTNSEKIKRPTEKNTFEERSSVQFPLAQSSLSVPIILSSVK